MKTFDYAGRTWKYDEATFFVVEVGRYKNAYQCDQQFPSWMLENAIEAYEERHVSDGYKRRLVMINEGNKKVIARMTSKRKSK